MLPKHSFYTELVHMMKRCSKRVYLIVAEDWNGLVGPADQSVMMSSDVVYTDGYAKIIAYHLIFS